MWETLCIPVFGPLVFTIRLFLRWLRMPDIQFHRPENITGPEELSWWHVPVSLKYRFFKPFPLNDISCTLIVVEGNKELELCFRPLQGLQPEYRIALHWGDTRYVPVCARATADNFPLGFTAPYMLIDGKIAEGWMLKRGIVRVTDSNHYFTFGNLTNLAGPSQYRVKLQLRIGRRLYAETHYALEVPEVNSDNSSFVLKEN